MLFLTATTLVKIVIVLIILLTVAPLIIYAERRQSAMMQDRIGPVRAGFQLPKMLIGPMRMAAMGGYAAGYVGAAAAVGMLVYSILYPADSVVVAERVSIILLLAAWSGVSFVGYFVLKATVDQGGKITVFGFLHPAADVLKALWKEDFVPPKADKLLHGVAPLITLIPAIALMTVIPFGPTVYVSELFSWLPAGVAIDSASFNLQIADINVGILYIFAIAGTGIVGAALAGYSSDNKYALLGGVRAASQLVSYEVTLGLSLVGCFMIYGSLVLGDMVAWQDEHVWGIFVQPLAFVLYMTAAIAENKRVPFDSPEGESEIVAGYFLEYSGLKFIMFFMAEFFEMIAASAIVVTLFFGGYHLPFLEQTGFVFELFDVMIPLQHWAIILISITAFVLKVIAVLWVKMTIRWTLPRFRYDQIMQLCWKLLLPLSLINILLTGIGILLFR